MQQMIKNVNPYAHKYLKVAETIAENPALDVKLVLRLPGRQVDPHRYNLPADTNVAVIMPTETTEALAREMLWSISLLRTIPIVTH